MRYLQLRWDNWNEMCDFAGVGTLDNGQPTGCWLDEHGLPTHTPRPDINRIGLLIPTKDGLLVARQTDFVVKNPDGLVVYTQGEFEKVFKPHRRKLKIRTWFGGKRSFEEAIITNEDLGYTEEEWRLLGDDDKQKAIEDWWFREYLSIEHEVIDE